MFTGIITDIGVVTAVSGDGDRRFDIRTAYDMSGVAIGASIACSGACLTVIEKGSDWFAVQASNETLSKTSAADWQAGTRLNLERALKIGDELGGHIVTGHVDGVAVVAAVTPDADSLRIDVDVPADLRQYVAAKGSATLDGVSLTVNRIDDARFSVNIIPHTQHATTLGTLVPGQRVNLEIDVLARYVARLHEVNG